MKTLKGMGILVIAMTVLCILGSLLVLTSSKAEDVDVIEMNSIVRAAARTWDNLEDLQKTSFYYDYIIFDAQGTVLLNHTEVNIDTLEDAIQHRYSMMNIIKNGQFLGTAVVLTSNEQNMRKEQWQLIQILISVSVIQVTVLLLYLLGLYHQILKPFEKLKEFAQQIARGNLDIPLKMDKYNTFGAFTESFDVMREELKLSKKKEYQANESKKELIASLSHDIKTPVTGIKLISELLEIQVQQPEIKEKIHTIYTKAEQINVLVTDMFEATLEELGELKVELEDEYASRISECFTRMDYEGMIAQGEIPECMVNIDIIRMEQVVSNIVTNSYKYAKTKIDVSYTLKSDYLEVNVKDYGKGVPTEELPLIFNRFYRGKSENVKNQAGTGLGLYISKNLIEKMGGEMSCFMVEDGFIVRLLIPLSSRSLE